VKIYQNKWEKSYNRKEHSIFYPNVETVKFINRFVRKKLSNETYNDVLDFSKTIKGLDFGCGLGRQVILMKEFGIDAYGIDIVQKAIERAKSLAIYLGYEDVKNKLILSDGHSIPFKDNFFDITISDGVLDSMHFVLAKKIMSEIDRVTKKYFYVSLISGDNHKHYKEFCGEEIVETIHENGTVQSYYNWSKINELVSGTNFKIKYARIIYEESLINTYKYGRYHIVMKKEIEV